MGAKNFLPLQGCTCPVIHKLIQIQKRNTLCIDNFITQIKQ
jgi:hypothetical protein